MIPNMEKQKLIVSTIFAWKTPLNVYNKINIPMEFMRCGIVRKFNSRWPNNWHYQ